MGHHPVLHRGGVEALVVLEHVLVDEDVVLVVLRAWIMSHQHGFLSVVLQHLFVATSEVVRVSFLLSGG